MKYTLGAKIFLFALTVTFIIVATSLAVVVLS